MRMAKLSALGEHRSLDAEKLGYQTLLRGWEVAPAPQETLWELHTKLHVQVVCDPSGHFSERMKTYAHPKPRARIWTQLVTYDRLHELALLGNEKE